MTAFFSTIINQNGLMSLCVGQISNFVLSILKPYSKCRKLSSKSVKTQFEKYENSVQNEKNPVPKGPKTQFYRKLLRVRHRETCTKKQACLWLSTLMPLLCIKAVCCLIWLQSTIETWAPIYNFSKML